VAQTATPWVAEQGGELGHGVGRGAQRDPAVCFGSGAAVDHGGGVEGVGESLGLGDQAGLDRAGVGLEVFEVADGGDAFGVRQSGIGQGGDLGVEVGCGHAAAYRTRVRIASDLAGISTKTS
jgi:hypothetical protein